MLRCLKAAFLNFDYLIQLEVKGKSASFTLFTFENDQSLELVKNLSVLIIDFRKTAPESTL